LFDTLNKPLIHFNKFDLTQKINDNFKDILGEKQEVIPETNEKSTPSFNGEADSDPIGENGEGPIIYV